MFEVCWTDYTIEIETDYPIFDDDYPRDYVSEVELPFNKEFDSYIEAFNFYNEIKDEYENVQLKQILLGGTK